MNHPHDEEWVAYLDGDASPALASRLAQHLEQCPQCAAEISGWRQSIDKLRHLSWPAPVAARRRFLPALRWAAAILILVSVFGLGRFSGPSRSEVKALVAAELKARQESQLEQIDEQLTRAIQEARAEDNQTNLEMLAKFQRQYRIDFLSLRKDLETLASAADAGLERANQRLTAIAVASQTTPNY